MSPAKKGQPDAEGRHCGASSHRGRHAPRDDDAGTIVSTRRTPRNGAQLCRTPKGPSTDITDSVVTRPMHSFEMRKKAASYLVGRAEIDVAGFARHSDINGILMSAWCRARRRPRGRCLGPRMTRLRPYRPADERMDEIWRTQASEVAATALQHRSRSAAGLASMRACSADARSSDSPRGGW